MAQRAQQANKLPLFKTSLGSVLVLGLGVSGTAVARFCAQAIAENNPAIKAMTIYAGKGTEATRQAAALFEAAGFEVIFDSEDVQGHYDTCVVSPGISDKSDFYKAGKSAANRIITEPEMAFELSPDHWVGITGTNGKTTTTALTAHLLNAAGIKARAVGNIGSPCIQAIVERAAGEYLVAELSSYQLASAPSISPEVAVLLNITPDHLAWHGSHENYTAAKMNLFANLAPDALAIVDVTDPDARACAGEMEAKGLRVLGIDTNAMPIPFDGAGVDGDTLVVNLLGFPDKRLCTTKELGIKGQHNWVNALAAAGAALYVGARGPAVIEGLKSFKALEHRIEYVDEVQGVAFYNDSKATNTDAAIKALTAFCDKPLILLLGGHDKMTSLDQLVQACSNRCKAVVCFGEAGKRFAKAFKAFEKSCPVIEAQHLRDALDAACNAAQAGDVICLSPACSSFDEFTSFEHRGEVFKQLVKERRAPEQ